MGKLMSEWVNGHLGGWTNRLKWDYFAQVTCTASKLSGMPFPVFILPAQVLWKEIWSWLRSDQCSLQRMVHRVLDEGETYRRVLQGTEITAGLGAVTRPRPAG